MSNPLERAARALCEMAGNPPGATMDGKPLWQDYLPEVRAVLAAVRQPNDAMIDAGNDASIPGELWGVEDVWQGMLDAVLEDQP